MNIKKVLIIIPAYNEEESIIEVVDNLIENYPQYDYLVVNDGSTDDTVKICKNKKYKLLDLPVNLGLSGAFQAGARYAYEMGYEMIVQIDGDGQHNPKYIADMLLEMERENLDIVIGSRFIKNKKSKFSMRTLGGKIIGFCIKITTGQRIYDPTSGMRLYNRGLLKEFAYIMNFTPEPDTISFLMNTGVKVKEIPVVINERMAGNSYLNVKNAMKYMIHMSISILLVQGFRARYKR